jgi:hypothetical protein
MTEIDIAKKALANAQDAYAETQSPETLDFIQRTQADLNRLYGADTAIDEDQIRLFNEIMSGQEVTPTSLFEVPSIAKPDPNAEKLKQILEGREQLREKQRQEEFAARPLPEKIEGAREAAGFLGSTIGRGMTYPFVELYGQATDQPSLGSEYLEGAELPKTDLGLEYTIRTGEALEPLATAMDVAKIPHTPFTVELLPLANMPFALSKTNIARAGQKAAEDVREAGKAASQVGRKAADIVEKGVETVQETLATPPVGAISLDALGFSSRLSEGVDKLQDKGTGSQFLAQLSKMKGVPLAEIKATGLDEYLRNTPKVTKQEVQDYLETNRLQLIEDERIAGTGRLTERDLDALPKEFDWLDRYHLDEDFEDKAHLRNHLMVTLNRHFDDLEADAADTGGFYAKDSSGEVRYIPESRKLEWLESEQDRIDDILSELPDFNSATKYPDEYLIPGGQNYREILYKIPDDKVEGVFRSPHFDLADNTFGSIRATDRTIDGTPTLFAEEIQSDWAIRGAKGGYGPQPMPDVDAETLRTTPDIEYRLSPDQKVFLEDLAIENDIAYFSPKSEERTKEIQRLQKKYDDWKATEKIKGSVPDNPFRGNWYKPVINNFLVKAAKEGKGGIGFPTGSIVSNRYGLSQTVDEINVVGRTNAVTGEKSRSVGIDTVAGQRIQFGVDNNGKIDSVRFQDHARFVGKGLDEVIGKSLAKKIMEGGSQTISGEGLKIGGEGKEKLYDDMLPKHLNEIGKRYGVQLEKRTTSSADVYFMPITEEMRNDILSEGLPMFKQGGSVKKFAPGGKVLKGISEGVKAAKNISKKDLQTIGSELETSRGLLPEVAKKYPQIRDASVAGIESITEGNPFTAYRGISLLPGRDLESEIMPSTTLSPGVALGILRDAPVMIRNNEFISPTSVLRQYPNIKPTDVEVFVPSMIEQIRERQPGALEMKIPTRSGGKMLINDIFDEVFREKEVLTDVTGKTPTDIKFDRHGGGFMDNLLMGVARDVFSGNWKGGENYLKEIGGYYTNPDDMIREFDAFASSIAPVKKAKGGPIKSAIAGAGKAAKEASKAARETKKVTLQDYRKKKLDRFLEGSQVTEPFYHGTKYDFSAFRPNLRLDLGSHLGTSEQANQFTMMGKEAVERGRVMPVYASIKNPLRLEDRGRFDAHEVGGQLVDMGLMKEDDFDKLFKLPQDQALKVVQKHIEDAGHDSVVYLNRREGFDPFGPDGVEGDELNEMMDREVEEMFPEARDSYIIFRPGQVKSATGNRGSFDPSDPDITKAKGGALRSVTSGAQRAAKEGKKMLQGVYRGYTGERLEEPVLSTTPQRKVAEYYATRRAATRGEDPHIEMLMVDPFVGKEYGLALPIDEFNRELLTTRARAIAPSDVVERTQLKKKGGLACLSK